MSKPPEPRPRSRACTFTITSSPCWLIPIKPTWAITGTALALEGNSEFLLGPVGGSRLKDGGSAELQHALLLELRGMPVSKCRASLDQARRVGSCSLDADVHVAFALGQIGDLMRPVHHPGSHGLGLLVARSMKDDLDSHRTGHGSPRRGVFGAHERPASVRSPPVRASSCCRAAAMKPLNSGAGRSGRDLNSGWNCEATKNGWSSSSTTSTKRSSGEVPEMLRPALCKRLRSRLLTS